MRIKTFAAAAIVAAVLMIPAAAWADSCGNVSRAAGPCGTSTTPACTGAPIVKGNWVWLPSLDPLAPPIWGFAPPGAPDSVAFGLPGSNGNYQNTAVTGNQSLLDNSAICAGTNTARQQTNGIQSGCL